MKIYIELLIVFAIFLIFIVWTLWYKISRRRLIKAYKPENDRGRKGKPNEPIGKQSGNITPEEFGIAEPSSNINGSKQSERRNILQKTEPNDVGENSNSNRKVRRRIFRRRK